MTITFNPGPSQLSQETVTDIAEIAASGLLSASHRSDRVRDVLKAAVAGLRQRLAA